jgi:DNA-binding beta-propeller fold protein YncE
MGWLEAVAGLVLVAAATLVPSTSAEAASGTWERAWGKNVVPSGGAGFLEVCTVAADCQAGSNATAFGGELDFPQGVATDAAGNVYVADTSNDRIQKFDPAGNFLLAWGKDVSISGGSGFHEVCAVATDCREGGTSTATGGELDAPRGVAVDAAGNVYVADTQNERIQKFGPGGNFIRTWGKDVHSTGMGTDFENCNVAIVCKEGISSGTGLGGELSSPEAVAAGASAVYVADTSNNRIQRFDLDGGFLLTWGENVDIGGVTGYEICDDAMDCQRGTAVGAALGGEFDSPAGVGIDPAGNVLVADSSQDRMQRFDSAGNLQLAWGGDVVSMGPGDAGTQFEICVAANGDTCKIGINPNGVGGELNFPQGVTTDATGAIYVSDNQHLRIQKFGPALNFLSAWGDDVVIGAPAVYEVCTAAAACQEGAFPPMSALGGELSSPYGLTTDAAGSVFLADAGNHRIQRFADPPTAAPPAPPASLPAPAATGQRAAALKKCKKKRSKQARKRCIKRAKKLPV